MPVVNLSPATVRHVDVQSATEFYVSRGRAKCGCADEVVPEEAVPDKVVRDELSQDKVSRDKVTWDLCRTMPSRMCTPCQNLTS